MECLVMVSYIINLYLDKHTANLIDGGRNTPCKYGGISGSEQCPAPGATLILYSCDGGDAWEVYQDEEQVAEGDERGNSIC